MPIIDPAPGTHEEKRGLVPSPWEWNNSLPYGHAVYGSSRQRFVYHSAYNHLWTQWITACYLSYWKETLFTGTHRYSSRSHTTFFHNWWDVLLLFPCLFFLHEKVLYLFADILRVRPKFLLLRPLLARDLILLRRGRIDRGPYHLGICFDSIRSHRPSMFITWWPSRFIPWRVTFTSLSLYTQLDPAFGSNSNQPLLKKGDLCYEMKVQTFFLKI